MTSNRAIVVAVTGFALLALVATLLWPEPAPVSMPGPEPGDVSACAEAESRLEVFDRLTAMARADVPPAARRMLAMRVRELVRRDREARAADCPEAGVPAGGGRALLTELADAIAAAGDPTTADEVRGWAEELDAAP